MRAAPPREGGIVNQLDKRKQPSEIRRLTSQRGVCCIYASSAPFRSSVLSFCNKGEQFYTDAIGR
jgi:hypothetical protein